jgi:hypothetical protein
VEELNEKQNSMNHQQRDIFKRVTDALLHQERHNQGKCHCKEPLQLLHFISGVGSFLFKNLFSYNKFGFLQKFGLKSAP